MHQQEQQEEQKTKQETKILPTYILVEFILKINEAVVSGFIKGYSS